MDFNFWIYFFKNMPVWMYFGFFMFFGGIYFLTIGPIIFKFWIIPRIEKQYNCKLYFDNPAYDYVVCKDWGSPVLEMSFGIFSRYFGRKIFINRKYDALYKINYDIERAGKLEIIISFISVFMFISTVVCGIIVAIHAHYHPIHHK